MTLTIQDASGRTVRTLSGIKNAGINRVMWDLRDEPTAEVRLRVSPLHAPNVQIPPEGRPAPMVGRLSVLQPPGAYTVKLAVDGREYTRQVVVRKDVNSTGSEADIAQQVAGRRQTLPRAWLRERLGAHDQLADWSTTTPFKRTSTSGLELMRKKRSAIRLGLRPRP